MTEWDRRITAAQGYVELGLHEEARAELAALPADLHDRVDVIELTLLCHMHDQRWVEALALAQMLCRVEPDQPGGFIHAAFCLHELGRTSEALDVLARGPATLRTKPVYYYNLGCYLARLGQEEKALQLLKQSFEMDGDLRRDARHDPDLHGLRQKLETI
jgi:tetratricopeptide (TPR) repeat protein